MNFVVVGAGRMGRRHVGALDEYSPEATVRLLDVRADALKAAEAELGGTSLTIEYCSWEDADLDSPDFDGAIVATTAEGRLEVFSTLLKAGIRHFLVEKPVEQSPDRFQRFQEIADSHQASVHVNFARRLQPPFRNIKEDLFERPQFGSDVGISFLSGALGIAANVIHDLDVCGWLVEAEAYEMLYADLYDTAIPSGRGDKFRDYGGRAVFDLLDGHGRPAARCNFHVNPLSSAASTLSFVTRNGKLDVNEIEGIYRWSARRTGSTLPHYRYNRDYEEPRTVRMKFNDLKISVAEWLRGLDGEPIRLPTLSEAGLAHGILFDWLGAQEDAVERFPIT